MAIADITSAERWMVQTTCNERRDQVELHPVDVELKLDPHSEELTSSPALFWQVEECSFVIVKTRGGRFRGNFFYQDLQQYGTGIPEYDDISECAVALLRVQADHRSVRSGAYRDRQPDG
ncbi:MAG: hypothetical protein OET44_02540 [Gammaproteobacteria bacterium]|nr:hypothetical protein [Gammaproteobacteria bacterium]